MAFIYDDLTANIKQKEALGYFNTKASSFFEISPRENFVYHSQFGEPKPITKETLIVYYCGAFTYFHKGHYNLIKEAYNELSKDNDDVRIVISPANSDYIKQKYGDGVDVSNKKRYDRIVKFLGENSYDEVNKSIIIDLNPMLNTVCDFNFTDLIKNFVEKYIPYYDEIKTPYILCGKDRGYFKELEKHTKKIKVFYGVGDENSSSNMINYMGVTRKKHILVRVHNTKEFEIFKSHMSNFYASITPSYISDEIAMVKSISGVMNSMYKTVFTNCKDYMDLLPYVKISRKFDNPLSDSIITGSPFAEGDLIIDSDIFSGTTKKIIENKGAKLTAIYDFSKFTDTHDIVDIDDLKKSEFRYPYCDLSSRMGLPLFDMEMHDKIHNLKVELCDMGKN